MSKSYTVTDQQGWTWLVADTDPAYPLCRTLDKTGFKNIALTSTAVITGAVTPLDDITTERMQNIINALAVVDQLPPRQRNKVIKEAELQYRLAECTEALCT